MQESQSCMFIGIRTLNRNSCNILILAWNRFTFNTVVSIGIAHLFRLWGWGHKWKGSGLIETIWHVTHCMSEKVMLPCIFLALLVLLESFPISGSVASCFNTLSAATCALAKSGRKAVLCPTPNAANRRAKMT